MVRISRNFLKSSAIYTLSGMLPVGSAIILLPFYIADLSTGDFGALSVYFAFSLFIQILTTFSFDTSLYIHYHEFKADRKRLNSFVSSAFFLMLGIGAFVGFVFFFVGDLVFSEVFSDQPISFFPYGLMTAGTGIFQALFKVHSNLLQSREKPELYFLSNVGSFILIVAFTVVGLKVFPGTLIGPVGGRLAAVVVSGLWAISRVLREYGAHFDFPLLKSSFSFNFYTFLYQLLQWVINYFDRIIMLFFVALDQVGVYDFGMKCLLVLEFVLNGLHNTFYPKVVSGIMAQPEKKSSLEINRYYYGFVAVIMVLVSGAIVAVPWLIETFVNKPSYREAVQYLPYIALIYIFRALRLFYAAPYGILKFTKPLPLVYLTVSAIKIVGTIVLLKVYGILGVVLATLSGALIELVLLRLFLRGKFLFKYNSYKLLIAPLSLMGIVFVMEPWLGVKYPLMVHGFYLIFCMAILFWAYRNEWKLLNMRRIIK